MLNGETKKLGNREIETCRNAEAEALSTWEIEKFSSKEK
jgi:hypothetical protein